MPFPRLKVRFNRSFGSVPREVYVEDPVNGVIQTVIEDCNKKLPDSELFEIQNQIKAGVTLDEVNTKVLGSGIDTEAVTEVVKTVTKKKTKSANKEEVNNEN